MLGLSNNNVIVTYNINLSGNVFHGHEEDNSNLHPPFGPVSFLCGLQHLINCMNRMGQQKQPLNWSRGGSRGVHMGIGTIWTKNQYQFSSDSLIGGSSGSGNWYRSAASTSAG